MQENPDKPTQIVFSAKGHVPQSIVLQKNVSSYKVVLQKAPGTE
jgi:hypothetical protein